MEEMKNFNSNLFGELSVIMRDGEPWFIAIEVAEKLGYKDKDKAVRRSVYEGDKIKVPYSQFGDEFAPAILAGVNKKTRHLTLLNESGFYQLVLRSKHPNAVKFQHWVTSEVLPTL